MNWFVYSNPEKMKRKNKIVGELKAYFSKGNVYSFIILKDNKSQNLLYKQRQIDEDFMIEVDGETNEIHLDGDPTNCSTNMIVRIEGNNGEQSILNLGFPPIEGF
jgi:hypothetical protein